MTNNNNNNNNNNNKSGLIPPHGGYRNLVSYQAAEVVYDFTAEFCNKYIKPNRAREIGQGDGTDRTNGMNNKYKSYRTADQMVQAARSGKQNIAEGSMDSGTSKKTELKLVGVARGSLEELLVDYEDFLRQRGLKLWEKNDPRAKEIRELAYKSDKSYRTYETYMSDPEAAANCAICLIHQANYLLDKQLKSLEEDFLKNGGFTERLYRTRKNNRSNGTDRTNKTNKTNRNYKTYIIALASLASLFAANPASAANSSIFTLEAWVKPTSSIASKAIVAKADEIRLVTDASGNPVCEIKNTTWRTATSSSAISVDTWSHISCSYDKVNLKVFVNGVETGSSDLTVAIDDTAAALKLGTDDSDDDVYGEFQGVIDDLRFYNYARSVKQIVSDMLARRSFSGGGNAGPSGSTVAHWKFDEGFGDTANDSSPHNNDGDLAGSCPGDATCPSWTNTGKFGKALSFDGGDWVDCGNPADGSLDMGTGDFSAEVWFYTTTLDAGYLLAKYTGIGYIFFHSGGNLRWGIRYDASHSYIVSGSGISTNKWHHAVGTKAGENIKLYLDGNLAGTSPIDNTLNYDNGNPLRIGVASHTFATFFNGSIDEVKIYNYALTEDEIRVEYNQGKAIILGATGTETDGKTPSFSASREYCVPGDTASCSPPVAEWNFNEQTGSSAFDTSENNNTGTITDATWTPSGKHGSALDFDGDGDYVNCESIADFRNGFTWEAWFKVEEGTTGNRTLLGAKNWSNYTLYGLWAGNVRFFNNGISVDLNGGSVTTGQWYHVAVTYCDTETKYKLYVNGDEKVSKVEDNLVVNSDLEIGRNGAGYYFNGLIDEVKIYDYARTPAQIAWSYNRGKPVAEWRFDECQGSVAHDESGNGNDGDIIIGATVPQTVLGTCEAPDDNTGAWYNGATGKHNSAMSFDGVDDYVQATVSQTKTAYALWVKNGSTWEHVVNNNGTYYVNGKEGTPTSYPIYVSGGTTVQIGKSDATTFVDCLIDEVKVFNYALTPFQVQTEYNNGAVNFE